MACISQLFQRSHGVLTRARDLIDINDLPAFQALLKRHHDLLGQHALELVQLVVQNKQRDFLVALDDSHLIPHEQKSGSHQNGLWFPVLDAIREGDCEWLELLYKFKISGDKSDFPPIFCALMWGKFRADHETDLKILEILIRHKENINGFHENETAIFYASKVKLWHCVEFLIQNNARIDTYCEGITARDLIRENIPNLLINIPEPSIKFRLFEALKMRQSDKFLELLHNNPELCNEEDDRGFTLLQRALEHNLAECAMSLLNYDIDCNKANLDAHCEASNRSSPPIIMAIVRGQKKVFRALLYHNLTDLLTEYEGNNNVFHLLARDWELIKNVKDIALECVNDLFKISYNIHGIDISDKNNHGKSAISLVCEIKDKELLRIFFKYGTFIFLNENDLSLIPSDYIEDYFDKSVAANVSEYMNEGFAQINFTFIDATAVSMTKRRQCPNLKERFNELHGILSAVESGRSQYVKIRFDIKKDEHSSSLTSLKEMSLFYLLSKSKAHKHLVKHPVVQTFLYEKLKNIIGIYILNFILYLIFTILLSIHVHNFIDIWDINTDNVTHSYRYGKYVQEGNKITIDCIWLMTFYFWAYLSIQKALKLLYTLKDHFVNESFEIILLSLVGYLLFTPPNHVVASITVIVAYIELTFLIGRRHPYVSTYNTIFMQVAIQSLSLLIIFFPVIFAFAFGFYILFHRISFSNNLGISLFKTFIMLTGEIDLQDLNIEIHSTVGIVIFIIFLIFIVIVFANVLNALAISDTQAIVDEAELLSRIKEIRLYTNLEKVLAYYILDDYEKGNFVSKLFQRCFSYNCLRKIKKIISINVCSAMLHYDTGSQYKIFTNKNSQLINKYLFGFDHDEVVKQLIIIAQRKLNNENYNTNINTERVVLLENTNITYNTDHASCESSLEERLRAMEAKIDLIFNALVEKNK